MAKTTADATPTETADAPTETPAPTRDPIDVAREIYPGFVDFTANNAGDVTCKNERGQSVLIPASKIAQYQ